MLHTRVPGTLVGENIYWHVYDDETFKFYPSPSNCGKGFPEVIAGGLRGGGCKSWSKICILSCDILEISTSFPVDHIYLVTAITYAGLLLVLVDIDGK
ncbi:unnamed protein product [Eruca vesicaria subsp. sativa]|uniref:Uncharacterized protein n=1 Tax=Eruca vesicaria subsp. sativa TaxID=29727 RepID=A0ABC8KGR4_ERUVS|nr:unnamed protein product [Eruca vesicaria subsp. sativa]